MDKHKNLLIASNCLFLGIVIGFFLAPIKNGISCGNNSGNTYLSPDK